MKDSLISIIIPIYNTGKRLYRCLDSILMQDYKTFECILVDDGSTDFTREICDKYASKDSRIRVFHKKNGGVSSARNTGIEAATGKWMVFVDSDDTLATNHLSEMLRYDSDDVDMILTGHITTFSDKKEEYTYDGRIAIGKNNLTSFFSQTGFLNNMTPWDRMYRANVIKSNNISFDTKLSISEDRLFCYHFLLYTRGIATTDIVTYYHDATDLNSLSYRLPDTEVSKNRYEKLHKAMVDIIKSYDIPYEHVMRFWIYDWQLLRNVIRSIYSHKKNIIKSIIQQREYFNKNFDTKLYQNVCEMPEIKELFHDKGNKMILSKSFFKYDLMIFFRYINDKFK